VRDIKGQWSGATGLTCNQVQHTRHLQQDRVHRKMVRGQRGSGERWKLG
jgi:hypothetical protein